MKELKLYSANETPRGHTLCLTWVQHFHELSRTVESMLKKLSLSNITCVVFH